MIGSYLFLSNAASMGLSLATNEGLIEFVATLGSSPSPLSFIAVLRRYFKDILYVGAFMLVGSVITDWIWFTWLLVWKRPF